MPNKSFFSELKQIFLSSLLAVFPQGAAHHPHLDLHHGGAQRVHDTPPLPHPHACPVRRVSLHGRGLPQRAAVLRQDPAVLYAKEVSARLSLLASGNFNILARI